MHIFLALPSSAETHGGKYGKIWYKNFYCTLCEMGHDVFYFDQDLLINKKKPDYINTASNLLTEVFQKEHKKKAFDLFFSYYQNNKINPLVIEDIKIKGVPTANFSCNNTHQFYLTKNLAPHYDYNLHSEKAAGEKFRNIGANSIWFQMAANPQYYHPINIEKTFDVTFVGQNYARRSYYIWYLLQNGVNIDCFGPKWLVNKPLPLIRGFVQEVRRNINAVKTLLSFSLEKRNQYSANIALYDFNKYLRKKYINHFHYPLTDDEMIKLYSQSKISLGFLEVFDNHDAHKITKQHLHLREFEAPMCGALYFTNYCEELTEFYEPDKEIITYRNEYELLDKVNFYLSHPIESEKVRHAGHKRALECHTYQKRFADLFKEIGIKNEKL